MTKRHRRISPLTLPPDLDVKVPGSKSVTNRALVAAALADGKSVLDGVLMADDTQAMATGLTRLGAGVTFDTNGTQATVHGTGGVLRPGLVELDARLSGTTARFLAAVVALGRGPYRLDAAPPMRARPMAPLLAALRQLGVEVRAEGAAGHLPVTVVAAPIRSARVTVDGTASSQFLSGLLLAAPMLPLGLTVDVTGGLVSRPYVDLTIATMRAFGAEVDEPERGTFVVPHRPYRPADRSIEPDATAAAYFLAAAAITGGRVRVVGLGRGTAQGDSAFADLLARMGADVRWRSDSVEVRGTGRLRGIDAELSALSDTAPTLAVVAACARGTTRVTGVGFIRRKETDRIAAVVAELNRCGIAARADDDGFTVEGGTATAARVRTYGDHRMAMSFALLGLVVAGIEITEPDCVTKTFPGYFDLLDRLAPARR